MSNTPDPPDSAAPMRTARAFDVDDPGLEDDMSPSPAGQPVTRSVQKIDGPQRPELPRPTSLDMRRGIKWGSILLASAFALVSLSAGLWLTNFVTEALARNDWIGWTATALAAVMAVSALIIILRELAGFVRLARLERLRKDVEAAIAKNDRKSEAAAVRSLKSLYAGRSDTAWGIARLDDHKADVLATGERLRIAEREIIAPIDVEVRRVISKSARRVATVTALSPVMAIAVGFVLVEAVRMLRAIAGLYGGRPGVLGGLRLARLVAGHIIATGGLAMTDDLLGQFLGQDLLRRLSRRIGEGAFNGALTVRLGVAAIDVLRPLPFLESKPVRVRDLLGDVIKSLRGPASRAS